MFFTGLDMERAMKRFFTAEEIAEMQNKCNCKLDLGQLDLGHKCLESSSAVEFLGFGPMFPHSYLFQAEVYREWNGWNKGWQLFYIPGRVSLPIHSPN